MKKPKRPKIKARPVWTVVDVDGTVLWGMLMHVRKEAVWLAKHPMRRLVRLYVREVRK